METPVLEAKHLGIAFGGLKAVDDFNISINEGELVGLIGPNGAGKTTVFNLLTGVYQPTEGAFFLCGDKMNGKKMHQVVHAGIARTFQNIRLFKSMTVLENVKVAFGMKFNYRIPGALFRLAGYWKEEASIEKEAMDLLKIFGLEEKANYIASNLPYGQQRKLEIARALATGMKLLLLDEPAAGMNPTETAELLACINVIRERFKIAILLIEHDMSLVMKICERIVVIDYGVTIAEGLPDEISTNSKVITAYLGSDDEIDEQGFESKKRRGRKMLRVENVNVSYGAIHALHDISLTVNDGEVVSLIGANGAGKTTTLRTITGLKNASTGVIEYDGKDLRKTRDNDIITIGMAHVPEGRHVFTRMTVFENLEMGGFILNDKQMIHRNMDMVYRYFPRLKERRKQLAGTLSGGEQQMLATGRALMSNPKIVLMDEPSMGLSPLLVKEIFKIIKMLHDNGITVLLVEQNAKMALSIADRAYVLETGSISMSGKASELLKDENVKKAYLGA